MRVALFLTCVNDTLYPDTGRAVVKLLTRLGVDVDFPMAQTCCGQAHYNTGYRHDAEPLARHFSDVFGEYEAIVTPSGSCGAMVRELYPRMGERARAEGRGDTLAATLAPVVPKTYELTGVPRERARGDGRRGVLPAQGDLSPDMSRTARAGTRGAASPTAPGGEGAGAEELPGADECCGFGGTFALKNSDVSAAMGADKVRNAESTGAEVLCAADNSCLMHIGGTMTRLETAMRPVHIAEILASTEEEPAV